MLLKRRDIDFTFNHVKYFLLFKFLNVSKDKSGYSWYASITSTLDAHIGVNLFDTEPSEIDIEGICVHSRLNMTHYAP